MTQLGLESWEVFLTGKTNFRKDIAVTAPYKGNRTQEKPAHLEMLRNYLVTAWGATMSIDEEADDLIAIRATELQDDCIIVSVDKDFNQTWFQMCFSLEHNFRNAISALHYRLFDMGTKNVGYLTDKPNETGLQTAARKVYNREKSLLNNRSTFAGLGNVSAGLSFRKYDWRTNAHLTLRHRIMSQLDNKLQDLDPALVTYVRKFRIPDSELFLRIIRCIRTFWRSASSRNSTCRQSPKSTCGRCSSISILPSSPRSK